MTAPTPSRPSRRVSLTKLQRESAAGIELIALCQSVAQDGQLSDEEIADLRDWVTTYAGVSLPARDYLDSVLTHVLADGIITPEERRDVYSALDKVLPPDLRADVTARRKAYDAVERQRHAPVASWDFMVAGCRYEGRPRVIEAHAFQMDSVFLVRDLVNKHSQHAVEVRLETGHHIGYVPESEVRELAQLLDQDHPYRARIKKILAGGRSPIPVVVVDVFSLDASVEGLFRRADAMRLATARQGCAALLAVGTSLLLLGLAGGYS